VRFIDEEEGESIGLDPLPAHVIRPETNPYRHFLIEKGLSNPLTGIDPPLLR